MDQKDNDKAIVFFDGYCNLCSGLVRFLIKNDKKDKLRFISLQTDLAKEILIPFNHKMNKIESVVLFTENSIYLKSDAVIKLISIIGGIWLILKPAQLIPKRIRDFIYDIIAKNRYYIFGKKQSCMVSIDKYKSKFLA